VIKIARRWRVLDAERAEAWVTGNPALTPDMKQRIMAPLRPPRPGRAPAAPAAADAEGEMGSAGEREAGDEAATGPRN
jgi:hypothetical protein